MTCVIDIESILLTLFSTYVNYLKYLAAIAVAILLMPALTTSCTREDAMLTDGFELTFSCDTVAFDTVFTAMGSTTRQVRVYNTGSQPVQLSSVTLQGGRSSRFRLNVDGDTSMIVRNLEIGAHDSIFIFIQANINPNASNAPFLVEDAILFNSPKGSQRLPLTAYGRNAVYHKPDHTFHDADGNTYPYCVIDCDAWDHTRPHVMMGYAVVDSGCTLHLVAGDELYFANDGYLWVYKDGTLDARGTAEQPVLFTSLRHDGWYDKLPGQWGYIWLSDGSKDNVLDWAVVENGYVGLFVNSTHYPTLTISNTRVENHSLAGVLGQGSSIVGDNLLVDNCGTATIVLQYGGRYQFSNSTFADYYAYESRTTPSVILSNAYGSGADLQLNGLQQATFRNCIIYGNYNGNDASGEILFDYHNGAAYNVVFDHCLLKSTLAAPFATSCITNQDPQFTDATAQDYHLKATSPAIAQGDPSFITLPNDLDNHPRAIPPTIGAFEVGSED